MASSRGESDYSSPSFYPSNPNTRPGSEYYDAFVSIRRGLFNTRDRAEHTRKRKMVSHIFSAKSVGQFEQYMHHNLELFEARWSQMAKEANGGYARLDALHWFNF